MAAAAVFAEIEKGIEPSVIKNVGCVYQFNITTSKGETKQWTVDLKNAPGSVKAGPAQKADSTISMKEEDFVDMSQGKLSGQQAFMQGKLKIQGNMSYAMKLNQLIGKKAPAKPAAEAPKAPAAESPKAPAAAADQLTSIMDQLSKDIAANPDVIKKVNGVYQFNITTPKGETKQWTVDLKNAPGSVKSGPAPKADCTLTLQESVFVDLFTGKLDGQAAFMQGKLKIAGNMSYALKLNQITKLRPKAKL
jgi:putative sterol carrier protein